MKKLLYNRDSALSYAKTWALSRNPAYYDFSGLGGDCTNFISQCVYSGARRQNYTPVTGWYYISSYNRTASWTSAEFFFKFLSTNQAAGPTAEITEIEKVFPADIIQLSFKNNLFTHSLIIISVTPQITVATHSLDSYNRPLSSYVFEKMRCLHIASVNG